MQHLGLRLTEPLGRAAAALHEMGIDRAAEVARAFPHQLSGGMKQRALIAAALACEPPLLILDEPTTALDLTVEAHILRLLSRFRRDKGITLLFISHNLGVVRRLCDEVAVMYASQLVELGDVHNVLERLTHPLQQGPAGLTAAGRPRIAGQPLGRHCRSDADHCAAGREVRVRAALPLPRAEVQRRPAAPSDDPRQSSSAVLEGG